MFSLDLHPTFRNNRDIELALRQFIFKAHQSGEPVAETIPGKGTGQLRERVLASLGQKRFRRLYDRVEVSSGNTGELLVHFARR
ncbi:Smr/MutS family protein [Streptomyces pseudogriseolus]|uniref:Smr/MutS family protein n=1 Tax=Streptomyces pseudogriseolus TaxID=36817 RepID=UPI003FA30A30